MGNSLSVKNKIFEDSKDGNRLIKIDELQIDRIQQFHHILKSCCRDTNYLSPISKELTRGIEVLDVGSGPGTWIFDMSSDYPKSKFTGIEIQSFMLPTIHPFNTRFIYHDVLNGIPFHLNSFNYIHMRCMTFCYTESQYEQIIKESVELLKPNGYLEICEPDVYFHNMGPVSRRIIDSVGKLLRSRSMSPFISNRMHEFMAKYGLRRIQQEEVMIPLSPLNGKVGELGGLNFYYTLLGLKDALAKQMKLSIWEVEQMIENFHDETRTVQMYCKYTRICGKKIIHPRTTINNHM